MSPKKRTPRKPAVKTKPSTREAPIVLEAEILPREKSPAPARQTSDKELDDQDALEADMDTPVSDGDEDLVEPDEAQLAEAEQPGSANHGTYLTGGESAEEELGEEDSASLNRLGPARALSQSDPLGRYLLEVRRHPLLSHEEESALLKRLREHGDIEAARALVSANLRLVVKIAFEYRSVYANVMDLIQEGNIGLMKAVSKFDPTKGAKLSYYASWWIRSFILKYLLDNFRLVRVGTTQAQKKLFYHLMREKERLEAQGLLPAPKLLAERLHVREKDVLAMEHRLGPSGAELSVDSPMHDSSGEGRARTLGDQLASSAEGVDQALEREELLRLLRARLPEFKTQLNQRETKILEERLLAEEPKTLQEVADLYGLTRERTRQIEAKVLEKLRAFLAQDLGT